MKLVLGVAITTVAWIVATILSRPTDTKKLRSFYRLVHPGGPGWQKVIKEANADNDNIDEGLPPSDLPLGILCMVMGSILVYAALFATGFYIYGNIVPAVILTVVTIISTVFLIKAWGKLQMQ